MMPSAFALAIALQCWAAGSSGGRRAGFNYFNLGLETDLTSLRDFFARSTHRVYGLTGAGWSETIPPRELPAGGTLRYDIIFAEEERPGHVHFVEFIAKDGRVESARISLELHSPPPAPGRDVLFGKEYFLTCEDVRGDLERAYGKPASERKWLGKGYWQGGKEYKSSTWSNGGSRLSLECRGSGEKGPFLAHMIRIERTPR